MAIHFMEPKLWNNKEDNVHNLILGELLVCVKWRKTNELSFIDAVEQLKMQKCLRVVRLVAFSMQVVLNSRQSLVRHNACEHHFQCQFDNGDGSVVIQGLSKHHEMSRVSDISVGDNGHCKTFISG